MRELLDQDIAELMDTATGLFKVDKADSASASFENSFTEEEESYADRYKDAAKNDLSPVAKIEEEK